MKYYLISQADEKGYVYSNIVNNYRRAKELLMVQMKLNSNGRGAAYGGVVQELTREQARELSKHIDENHYEDGDVTNLLCREWNPKFLINKYDGAIVEEDGKTVSENPSAWLNGISKEVCELVEEYLNDENKDGYCGFNKYLYRYF